MLSKQLQKRHFVLKKGKKFHIVFTLLLNQLLLLKLFLYKSTHGINHPIVHYYAVCWNEEKMLPFMFDYYGRFTEKFIIFDNYSSDCSNMIIQKKTKTQIIKFKTEGFNDLVHMEIKNNCWKKSRGKADYVVVCDMDEFIFHPEMDRFLKQMKENRWTIIQPQGFDMYSTQYPTYDGTQLITDIVRTGVASKKYSKSILFDPHGIVEINYDPGCHCCHPLGFVNFATDNQSKLLHYKNLGLDYLLGRTRQLAKRLSKENLEAQYGCEYLRDETIITSQFQENLQNSKKII